MVLLFNRTETDADIQPCLMRSEGCHTFPTAPDLRDVFCLFHVTWRAWEECHPESCQWQWDTAKHSWHAALYSWMCSSAHNEWERKGECYRRREGKETRPQRRVWGLLCCSWTLWELANFICSPQPSEYSGCSSPSLCVDSLGGLPWWAKTLGDVL